MQQLLLEQDGDLYACRRRLGELESTLYPAFTPSSASSVIGDLVFRIQPTRSAAYPVASFVFSNSSRKTEYGLPKGSNM